jgi:hypothetical protein
LSRFLTSSRSSLHGHGRNALTDSGCRIPFWRTRKSASRRRGQRRLAFARAFRVTGRDRVSRGRSKLCRETTRVPARARQSQNVPVSYLRKIRLSPSQATQQNIPICRDSPQALIRTRTGDPLLTLEVLDRHARTRAITSDTLFPANRAASARNHASRGVARVLSDVSVLCPRRVVQLDNAASTTRPGQFAGGCRLGPSRRSTCTPTSSSDRSPSSSGRSSTGCPHGSSNDPSSEGHHQRAAVGAGPARSRLSASLRIGSSSAVSNAPVTTLDQQS